MSNILTWWRTRSARLAFSMVMLTMSMLFIADFLELRGNEDGTKKEARKTVAEALAVQLSTLATAADTDTIRYAVANFVNRSQDVVAAALMTSDGTVIAKYGEQERLSKVRSSSSSTHLSIPITQGDQDWGEVRVVFNSTQRLLSELSYFGFVLAGCFLVYLLFLRKVLTQLDPSQVVPARVNSAFNLLSEGVVILDDQLRILLVNEALAEAVGKPSEDLIGQSLDDWAWEATDETQAPWATSMYTGLHVANQPQKLRISEQDTQIFMVNCAPVGSEEEGMRGVMVTLNNMTAIEHKNAELAVTLRQLRRSRDSISEKNKELEELATQDPLTGLANRRALMTFIENEFAKAKGTDSPLSCIMVDIDFFKRINDSLGHKVGDEVICAVSNTLVAGCRPYDLAGRYGGEEFVIVLPGLNVTDATIIAERLRQDVEALASDVMVPVDELSASFGVASVEEAVNDTTVLIERADQALYAAKQGGRNRVFVFDARVTKLVQPGSDDPSVALATAEPSQASRLVELEAVVEERNRDLQQLREFDALTGIPERALFLRRIEKELQRATRFNTKLGLLSIEITDLYRIASSFGHEACDALIIDVIERLERSLRDTDAVSQISDNHNLSRVTSNEYGVLLTDLEQESNIMPVITRIRRVLSKPFLIEEKKIYLGASIGASLLSPDCDTSNALLTSASAARAKASLSPDKISHSFSSTSLDKASREYVELEADLYEAFENGDFEVYFQPKIVPGAGTVTGIEALLRWQHPERGFVSPLEFIGIAESNGLIHELSKFVLERSTQQLKTWREFGWSDLRMAVNVSPLDLRRSTIVSDILTTIDRVGIPRDRLEIELTESSLIDSPQRARIVLGQLRDAGVTVAMDDFGTGYSSLALLADLPLDAVKIDRSFVIGMEDDRRCRAIVESVINMAHALGLRVVGEGVETNEALEVLSKLGCHEVQGYLISRPCNAAEITTFLRKQEHSRHAITGTT